MTASTLKASVLSFLLGVSAVCGQTNDLSKASPQTIRIDAEKNIQEIIDGAPTYSIIEFNPNRQLVFSKPLKISKPLTLRGINAKLPEKLGKSPLITVDSTNVTIEDFQLYGNTESVSQDERAPLIFIEAGDFRVQHGLVVNSSRHGVYVAPSKQVHDIVGGVIRDIVGRGNARCVVAVGDRGEEGVAVHNVLIENIRCYDSSLRGAVNVKDGNDNITVRDIYSENSVYAVDVQDHKQPGQVNRNIVVENVYALKCRHAVRTNNRPLGHQNLTIRDVTSEQCAIPLRISNTEHVTLENIRVLDHTISEEPYPPLLISNCRDVVIRDITVKNSNYTGPALALVNDNDTTVDGFTLQGPANSLTSGISFLVATNTAFSGLRISHVSADSIKNTGIVLESNEPKGSLANYLISENLTRVVDNIHGQNGILVNNFSSSETASAR